MRFAALGRTSTLYKSIEEAVRRGHQCVLVGTCPAAPEYGVTENDFVTLAARLGVPSFCDVRINRPEYLEMVRRSAAEVALSINWQTLIGSETLDAFPHGILNGHFGDLPRYRGNAVCNWAILAGESEVAFTVHRMVDELDAGPIFLKHWVPLTPDTRIGELYELAERLFPNMFGAVLDGLQTGTLGPQPQPDDPSLSLRCFPRLPRDSRIDWEQPAETVVRLVRAVSEPFTGAYTHMGSDRLCIWRARVGRSPGPYHAVPGQVTDRHLASGEVAVAAGEGWVILEEVEIEEGIRVAPATIIRSVRTRLGMDPTTEIEELRRRLVRLELVLHAAGNEAKSRISPMSPDGAGN